jgi:hypothetical protein
MRTVGWYMGQVVEVVGPHVGRVLAVRAMTGGLDETDGAIDAPGGWLGRHGQHLLLQDADNTRVYRALSLDSAKCIVIKHREYRESALGVGS